MPIQRGAESFKTISYYFKLKGRALVPHVWISRLLALTILKSPIQKSNLHQECSPSKNKYETLPSCSSSDRTGEAHNRKVQKSRIKFTP